MKLKPKVEREAKPKGSSSFALKTTNLIYTLGVSLVILGLSQGFFSNKEYKQAEIKPISNERACAIEAIWHEARNTSARERRVVLEVILNRVKSNRYPDTICEVVHQPKQFSYYNDWQQNGIISEQFQNISSKLDQKVYLKIESLVDSKLFSGRIKPNSVLKESVMWYHTKNSNPYWAKGKKPNKVIVDKSFLHVYYSSI